MKEQNSSKSITRTLLLGASLSAIAPLSGYADQTPFFLQGTESIDRLRQAVESIQSSGSLKQLLIDRTKNSLSVSQRITGDEIETTKFQHYYKGLEVVGSMAFHHRGKNGEKVRDTVKRFEVDTTPGFQADQAVSIAMSVAGDRGLTAAPELKILPNEQGDSAKLVYWVKVDEAGVDGGRQVILDAHSGQVIGNISDHQTIAPIRIYSAKNQGLQIAPKTDSSNNLLSCQVKNLATGAVSNIGGAACNRLGAGVCQLVIDSDPVMVNPSSCTLAVSLGGGSSNLHLAFATARKPGGGHNSGGGSGSTPVSGGNGGGSNAGDASTANASTNSQAVLNYYITHQNRNSYDNAGATVVSVVHGGVNYDNAHWDVRANQMVYGDGDGKVLGDFSTALDVAGHEMTHGVTAHTAQLLMMGESGALNEAYSDFFGVMISGAKDWAIGKKIFVNPATAKGVRDLGNPHNISFCAKYDDSTGQCAQRQPDPANISELVPAEATCDQTNDNCWVHINATIPGHASYLVVQAIGQEKAEKLYYTVLTQALSSRDDIRSAAETTKQTCSQMYDQSTCDQVNQAFAQVGL